MKQAALLSTIIDAKLVNSGATPRVSRTAVGGLSLADWGTGEHYEASVTFANDGPIVLVDPEGVESDRFGPFGEHLPSSYLRDDGVVVVDRTSQIVAFRPSTDPTALPKAEVIEGDPCEALGLGRSRGVVEPGTGAVHTACRDSDGTAIVVSANQRRECPKGQSLVALGYSGSMLCSGSLVVGSGRVIEADILARPLIAVRALEDGAFMIVREIGDPGPIPERQSAIIGPSSLIIPTAPYPDLPASIDDVRLVSTAVFGGSMVALDAEGRLYQLVRRGDARGPLELFRQEAGAPEAVHLASALPAGTLVAHLVTGP